MELEEKCPDLNNYMRPLERARDTEGSIPTEGGNKVTAPTLSPFNMVLKVPADATTHTHTQKAKKEIFSTCR